MQFSWKTALLRQHPMVITLEGVEVTASPRAEDEWAAGPAVDRAQALKRAALAAAAELAAARRSGAPGAGALGAGVAEAGAYTRPLFGST